VVEGLVDRGWAIAVTDYQGLGTPGDHAYTVKDSAAHSVIDIVRAAQRIPGSGGVPSDLQRVGQHLNTAGSFYFSFLLYAEIGLDTAYPELDLEGHLNPTGTAIVNTMRNSCLLDGLFGALFQRIENLTTRNALTERTWPETLQPVGQVGSASAA
jgi:hypothetical protein